MNVSLGDFLRIRWGLLFLVLAMLIGFAMTTTAQKLVVRAKLAQQQLQTQQRDMRNRLMHAPEEEQELRGKIALFQQLQERGIIGQEERLNWVEQISQIKTARRLFDLQYELSPQKALTDAMLPGGAVAGDHELMASTMNLQMPLLHENDLLGFLTDLRRAVHAHILVRDCTIERIPSSGDGRLGAQLRAVCTIDWITLREKRQ